MADHSSPTEQLWNEYSLVFRDFDDLTLARWMVQTLGQLEGRVWRLSHPLVGCYRLAAALAHDRQIWFKRLVNLPATYQFADCCRAPLLPLLTRDVIESGLICEHCGEAAVEFESLPADLQHALAAWADEYQPVHKVAHWDENERKRSDDYERDLENAAQQAEQLLTTCGQELVPKLLDLYPAVVWEDQDECLQVRPEDIRL